MDDLSQGFIRQRRNLLAITIVMALIETVDLNFTQINILGNKSEIGRPELVGYWLWLFFIYFVWRYFSYFLQIDRGFLSAFRNKQTNSVRDFAYKKLCNDIKVKERLITLEKALNRDKRYKVQIQSNSIVSISYDKEIGSYKVALSPSFVYKDKKGGFVYNSLDESIIFVSNTNLYFYNVKSFISIFCFTHRFNEYYLPIMLATALVIYKGITLWH